MTDTSQRDSNGERPIGTEQDSGAVKPVAKRRYTFLEPDEDEQEPGTTEASAPPQAPGGDKSLGYGIYPGKAASDEAQLYSFRVRPESLPQQPAGARQGAPPQIPLSTETGAERQRPAAKKSGAQPLEFFVVGGVVLLAIYLAVSAWNMLRQQQSVNDLGAAVSTSTGLRGHLTAKWEGKAEYLLRIEAIGQQQLAGFAAAVSAPPQPVSFDIQLKDASGFVVCSKQVLLRFDPGMAAALAEAHPRSNGANAASGEAAQEENLQSLMNQEQERQRGKDIFQPEIGKEDGQIIAIDAQGTLPCDAKAYGRLDYWDFSTNFPTLAEQSALLKRVESLTQRTARSASQANEEGGLGTAKHLSALLEADDVITGYAPASGVIETSAGRIFVVDRGRPQSHSEGWQVFPAPMHYRCNKSAVCVITRAGGSAVLYARLKK